MNCANECSTAAIDTLQSSLETKLDDIKATLDRIEQILSYSVRGTAQGSRSELRQYGLPRLQLRLDSDSYVSWQKKLRLSMMRLGRAIHLNTY
jgi:hypothetical protein